MRRNYVRHYNPLFSVRDISKRDEVQKFLALEYHPRQRQRSLSSFSHTLTTLSLMY